MVFCYDCGRKVRWFEFKCKTCSNILCSICAIKMSNYADWNSERERKIYCIDCAKERIDGRLRDIGRRYLCSRCGKKTPKNSKFAYCPYCGGHLLTPKGKTEKIKNKL